jgi:nanoRNase/pAp phosphatase (c-di-AMP/oligoRNAs hydrolase)
MASDDARERPASKKKTEPKAPIEEMLSAHQGERHLIVLHDFPDPDCISSGFAHQIISESYEIKCDIIYGGRISHQQNIALVRLIGIQLVRFDGSQEFDKYSGAVFVDNQGTTAEAILKNLEEVGVPCLFVVDHHESQHRLEPAFEDIRKDFGATASIYAEYLERGSMQMEKSRKEHVMVATALTHGIITDTNGFIRATPEDFHAAAYLSRFRDAELLEQIMNQARSKHTMSIIQKALQSRITTENFSIAGIGYLRDEDRDAIPQAADFLLTEENMHTAIVYGIVSGAEEEEVIVGSMRTVKITLDPDEFIKEALGKNAKGTFYGGGKMSAGGFQIPLGFLSNGEGEEYRDQKWRAFDTRIKQKVFEKLGVKVEGGT